MGAGKPAPDPTARQAAITGRQLKDDDYKTATPGRASTDEHFGRSPPDIALGDHYLLLACINYQRLVQPRSVISSQSSNQPAAIPLGSVRGPASPPGGVRAASHADSVSRERSSSSRIHWRSATNGGHSRNPGGYTR